MEDFAQELTPGNAKVAFGPNSLDLWQIEPHKIQVLEGYNVRIQDEKYTARVRWLADRMKANGYDRKHPLGGYVAKIDGKDVPVITAGHRRLAGVLLAISEGAPIEKVPMVVSPRGAGMEELTLELITSNDGDPLTTYEKAIVVKRLAAFGWDSQKIADKVGLASAQYVDGLLGLAGAPLPIRRMVMENVVAATAAIDAIKKHGNKAHQVLLTALVKSGGGRVTPKHMPQADFKKAIKKQAEPMYTALTKIQADPGFSSLSEEVRGILAELLGTIKK